MSEYKCISCGYVKESDSKCSCPVCGYKMFEVPYDRKNVLESEIKGFFTSHAALSVTRDSLVFEGKDKHDHSFPGYDRILKYVSDSRRTEDFLSNLLETVEQLKIHFTSQFSETYPVSFEEVNELIELNDEAIYNAANVLIPEINVKMKNAEWGNLSLHYSETQDESLWVFAEKLLDLLEVLAQKIVKFIKINNLYGDGYKYRPNRREALFKEELDYKEKLKEAIADTESIIAKKYILDITDDGSDELKEMLTCLWHAIELIMHAPLFVKKYEYQYESYVLSESELLESITKSLKKRYGVFFEAINLDPFLNSKSEDELFECYKDLIGIDKQGILAPIGAELINIGESERKLGQLIGLKEIKESIAKIKAYALANKDSDDLNIHMCFMGNPGSGKTEVARYIAGILYENKILPTKNIVEVDRSGLVSQYFGATAEKTSRVISRAMGGVLFIDEAYALGNNSETSSVTDYGKEAIDTLVKAMEDNRGKFCVILAGYKNEMLRMLSTNPGFKSRIQFSLDFPNYSRDELKEITNLMLRNRHYSIGDAAMNRILDITDVKRKEPNFANAREIRNILDQVIMCQNIRCAGTEDKEIGVVDVNRYIQDSKINLPTSEGSVGNRILSGEEELDQLIGLDTVKRTVKKIKAYAKRNKGESGFNLHMCFYGNPGTGKTEVARILSRILYDAGVLNEAKLVETDGHGLLGQYVGETGPKTRAKINDAMNGVLFIDEAYSLANSKSGLSGTADYGDEAIAVLLKEMEDHRGQFCVILAGYKDEMKDMLSANPGFQSRIQFTLEFPDYSRDELQQIAMAFLEKKKYKIDSDALEEVLDITEYFRKQPNFANARTVRNILDQVLMNQNLRTEDDDVNRTVIKDDVDAYMIDEKIDINSTSDGKKPIGFVW